MLSFQARKKEDNYLVPVYNYMNGGAAKPASTPTQSSSKYMSTPTSNYLPKSQNVQKPIYQPYASLQSSMRTASKPGYTTPTVNKPVVKPPVTTPTPQVQQPTSPLSKLQQIGANRQQFAQQQAQDEETRQKGIFDVRSKALEAQKPELETRLNNYRDLSRQVIAGQEEQTRLAKEGIEQSSGEEMRLNAQTAREGRGRVQSTLAGLNALDSSTTGQLLAKAEGNLSNNQATALRSQKQQLSEADNNLVAYKQQAQLAEDDEIAKFNEAIRQISANYDINSLEYQNAVKQAYDKAQESIYNIEEGVANAELENQKYYDKLSMDQTAGGKLTDKQSMAQTGLTQIQQARDFFVNSPNINKSTKIPGVGREYDTVITSLVDMIGRMRSGGAINVDEEKRFRQLLPNFMDNPQSTEYKMAQLEQEFSNLLGQSPTGMNVLSGMSGGQGQQSQNDPLGIL